MKTVIRKLYLSTWAFALAFSGFFIIMFGVLGK